MKMTVYELIKKLEEFPSDMLVATLDLSDSQFLKEVQSIGKEVTINNGWRYTGRIRRNNPTRKEWVVIA